MTKNKVKSRQEVVVMINSLLLTSKKAMTQGLPIPQLEAEYREMEGMRIPFRELGFSSLNEFLMTLHRENEIILDRRNTMTVILPCIKKEVEHIGHLVSRQKESTNHRSHARGGRRLTNRCYTRPPYVPPSLPTLDSQTLAGVLKLIQRTPEGIHVEQILQYLQDRNHSHMNKEHLIRQLRELYHDVTVRHDVIYPLHAERSGSMPSGAKKTESLSNGHAGQQIHSTGIFHSNKLAVAGDSYREDDDDDDDEDDETRFAAAPIDENANGDRGDNDNRESDVDAGILVNSRTRFRLEKLIQQHPDGIWCVDLPELYHKAYGFPFNYEGLGFSSVSDIAAQLPDIFHCVRLQKNGDFKLFDAKAPMPETTQKPRPKHLSLAALYNIYETYGGENQADPLTVSHSTALGLIPDGVMTSGETVGQLYVTSLFPDDNDTIDVVVMDVATPTLFWIHLLQLTSKFDRFMTELHNFYSEHAKKYVIPLVLLEKGLQCACIYDGKWHRGIIKTVKYDNTVTVMFYDYGTVTSYPAEEIHFLHRSFSGLPAQAIACGLHNVRPKSTDKWPYSACQAFAKKVLNVSLVAMLGSMDADNNTLFVGLVNTNGPEDIYINDWMVTDGYAIYGKMVDTVDLNETLGVDAVANGETSSNAENDSSYSSAPTGRHPGQTTSMPAILEESELIYSTLQDVIEKMEQQDKKMEQQNKKMEQQNKKILAMESVLRVAIAKGFTMDSSLDAANANVSPAPSAIHRTIGEDDSLQDLFSNLNIASQNQQQIPIPEPPPVPLHPVRAANFVHVAANDAAKYEPKIVYRSGNDYAEDNANLGTSFEIHDVNMNSANNPFNVSPNSTSTPRVQTFGHHSQFVDSHQLRMAYAANNSAYQFKDTAFQAPTAPVDPQPMEFRAPVDLVTPRETFEMSLEQSAKAFFERLETRLRTKNRDSNPFAPKIENANVHRENVPPAESVTSPRIAANNPFASEGEAAMMDFNQANVSQPRVVYEAAPVIYDISGKASAQSEDRGKTLAEHERELLEASKQFDLATWIRQGRGTMKNPAGNQESNVAFDAKFGRSYESHPCDFSRRTVASGVSANSSDVPLPISQRPQPTTSPVIQSGISEAAGAAALEAVDPVARCNDAEWFQATEKVKTCISKRKYDDGSRRNVSVGGPIVTNDGRVETRNEGAVTPEYVINGENTENRKGRMLSVEYWYFQEIPLTRQSVFLIRLDNEGWLIVDEFQAALTTTKLPEVMLKILEIQNAHIPFRFIQRSDYPSLFESLESKPLGVPRKANNKIGDTLHLLPIRSILTILRKLKIANIQQIELAMKKQIFPPDCSALFDAYTIITAYKTIQEGPPL